MADYKAPLRDMRFVLNEVFEVAKLWAELPALAETVDAETVEAILEEAGKVTSKSIAPLSRAGDEEGCHWADGVVTTPAGFPQAYQTYAEGGWVGVGGDPAYGGMGMPKAVMLPASGAVNPKHMRMVVVLPAPLGPIKAWIWPRLTLRLTPLTATKPLNSFTSSLVFKMKSSDMKLGTEF